MFFLVFCIPSFAFAEREFINIQGLSFECDSCKKTEGNQCEIPLQGKTLTGVCETFLNALLNRAIEDQAERYPTEEELLAYIGREDVDHNLAGLSFELLSKRIIDQITLGSAIDSLIAKHLSVLKEAIEKRSYRDEVYTALWHKRSKLPIRETFILMKALYGIEAFYIDLTVNDIKKDLSTISTLIQSDVLTESEKTLFGSLSKYIQTCSEQIKCDDLSNDFGPEAIKYSQRLQNFVISDAILKRKLIGIDALKLLAQTQYVDTRTPDTYKALLKSLRAVLKVKPFDEDWKKLPTTVVDFITFMSQDDPRVAELIYRTKSDPESWKKWAVPILVLLLLVIIGGSTLILSKMKDKKQRAKKRKAEVSADPVEVDAIWTFFGLPVNSGLGDLKRRYREMAFELHPDSGNENPEKFMQLNNYYKRAMDLLK